jgi:hypothetical protein
MEDVGRFHGHLVYLRPFYIFHGHLVYFVAMWYIFPPFWYIVPRKIWQPWFAAAEIYVEQSARVR